MDVITVKEMKDKGIDPEILFWVGCAGSFDDRAKKITKSFVNLLNKAGVSFAVLGTEESCTGDPARRAGNEFLFQMQAMRNIEILKSCPNIDDNQRVITKFTLGEGSTEDSGYKITGGEVIIENSPVGESQSNG